MTLKIEVSAHPETGPLRAQIDEAFEALGFQRIFYAADVRSVSGRPEDEGTNEWVAVETVVTEPPAEETAPKKRGRPAKTAEKAPDAPAPEAPASNISTGEDRVDPESPETQAQDAADEAAESVAQKDANGGKLTLDDVRQAAGRYIEKFGMAVGHSDIAEFIGRPMADLGDDQANLAAALKSVDDATEQNPKGRRLVADGPEPEKAAEPAAPKATKQDVVDAMRAYAMKFDGTSTDTDKMVNTLKDVPLCLTKCFEADGVSVQRVSDIPSSPENFGRAVQALQAMTKHNPFDRKAVS